VFSVVPLRYCLVVNTSAIDYLESCGKTRLWNDLLCVKSDVKPYTPTHWLTTISTY